MTHIPLVPHHTVLFPGGTLPLRIFEAPYIDMVSECLHTSCGFGVCLIRRGRAVGAAAVSHEVGTCNHHRLGPAPRRITCHRTWGTTLSDPDTERSGK
jgi:Lon protease-like protein